MRSKSNQNMARQTNTFHSKKSSYVKNNVGKEAIAAGGKAVTIAKYSPTLNTYDI